MWQPGKGAAAVGGGTVDYEVSSASSSSAGAVRGQHCIEVFCFDVAARERRCSQWAAAPSITR
jgi:hypothetical protein